MSLIKKTITCNINYEHNVWKTDSRNLAQQNLKLSEEILRLRDELGKYRKANQELNEELETLKGVISVQTKLNEEQGRGHTNEKERNTSDASDSESESFEIEDDYDEDALPNVRGKYKASTLRGKKVDGKTTKTTTKPTHRRTKSGGGSKDRFEISSETSTPRTIKPEDKGKDKTKVPVPEIQVPRKSDADEANNTDKPDSGRSNKNNKISQEKVLSDSQSSAVSDSIKALSVSAVGDYEILEEGPDGSKSPRLTKKEKKLQNEHPAIFDENTVLDILCGLGITSSRQFDDSENAVLIPEDYSYSYQFKVRRRSNELLKFKDFAPKVFHQIRKQCGVSEADLLVSFRYDNLTTIKGAGKSGAFFIFTNDKRFMLKTATKEERDFLWQLLPYYLQYLRKYEHTLLPRFLGVYSMKHEGIGGVVRFVVMNNVFYSPYKPIETYDLKGSTVGRTAGNVEKKGTILKDLDIKRKLHLPPNLKGRFLDQLRRDSAFLAEHNVMDYSLLVGVYYETEENKESDNKARVDFAQNNPGDLSGCRTIFQAIEGGMEGFNPAENRKELYFTGIIDILQRYKLRKKLEHLFKSIPFKGDELSVVEPSFYAKRFWEFMSNNVVDTEGDATLVGSNSNFTSRRESDSEEDSVIEKEIKSSKDKKKDKTRTRSDSA
jgi:1-phosphatidylinositol-4-phosphate 5-kinase